jgi:signal transduction histidine kinase/ActR/RegA family two-component response regulator
VKSTPGSAAIFPEGGTAGQLLRATDWSLNPLGPVDDWSMSLKAIVRMMLSTRQATCLFWGPDLINLYNDGFIPLLGEKHPQAMGQPARVCWSDAWPVVGDLLTNVVERADAVLFAEMLVPIVRGGRLEDAWWNYSYSPVFDDAGAIAGVLVVATETTAEVATRRRESELRQLAEAASGAKDEFLAMVSHELRNPLNAILGWSRILGDGNREPRRVDKGLQVIERNARAQSKLIDEILDVARIGSGKVVLDLRRVRLTAVVQSAVDSIRPAADAKGVRLLLALDDESVDLIADEDRLHQVVWNLLSNAVKFTSGGGEVRVAAARQGSAVVVRVEDTGRGISAQLLPFVFDRFRQGDSSTTKQHAGLGLGLAIVRSLVELHGGTASAYSEGEGRGARFEILLPLRAVEPRGRSLEPAAGVEVIVAQPGLGLKALRGAHVLVVDDEQDARDLVATVLQEAGADVTAAASVAEAMAILTSPSAQVTVVVSDVGMPAEDGYTLIQRVRAQSLPVLRDIPALALTAYARAEDRQRAIAAGFQQHAAKPVDPDALVRAVVALVGLGRG